MAEIEDLSLNKVHGWLKPRELNSHKGMFGNVLLIGGDYGMPGSVRIAAEAALRVGAGIVTVVTRKEHVTSVVSARPELLCYGVDSDLDILDTLLKKATVIVIGPGLGQSAWSIRLFDKIINLPLPMIIDADALNLLAKLKQIQKNYPNWILTPHPGEAARLLLVSSTKIQQSREESILQLQAKYGSTIVLKGQNTLIAADSKSIKRCVSGNPGMASAGMGDLLSGIIAGLVAQKLELVKAAVMGVILHANAGDLAMKIRGSNCVLAMDLLDNLQVGCN